jgi:hypothetical protein
MTTIQSPNARAAREAISGVGRRSPRRGPHPGRRSRAERISDAVVANYIHAISTRGG